MREDIRSRQSWELRELSARVNGLENNVRQGTDGSGRLEVGALKTLSRCNLTDLVQTDIY